MSSMAAIISALIMLLTALGGCVAWVAAKMNAQTHRFDRMEERYNKLDRAHTLVLVQVERFRLALQIAVAALVRHNPKDVALVHIQALLADQFIFPTAEQVKTPPDMQEAMDDIQNKDGQE